MRGGGRRCNRKLVPADALPALVSLNDSRPMWGAERYRPGSPPDPGAEAGPVGRGRLGGGFRKPPRLEHPAVRAEQGHRRALPGGPPLVPVPTELVAELELSRA